MPRQQNRSTDRAREGLGRSPSQPHATIAPTIVAVGGVNLLHGKVARRGTGSSGVEVSLQITPGLGLVGFADAESPLKLRQLGMAAVEENAVVIGLAG